MLPKSSFTSGGGNPPSTWGSQFPYPERAAATKNIIPPILNSALMFEKYNPIMNASAVIITRETGRRRELPKKFSL